MYNLHHIESIASKGLSTLIRFTSGDEIILDHPMIGIVDLINTR